MQTLFIFHQGTMIEGICESVSDAISAERYYKLSPSIKLVSITAPTLEIAWAKLDYMLDGIWKQNNTGRFPNHMH